MGQVIRSIPRPLVRINQFFIVTFVVLTWITGSEALLLLPLVNGLLALIFKFNPVMRFSRLFLKKKTSQYIPEDYDQQQFNQKIAVACLFIAFAGYSAGYITIAHIFTILVALAAFIAILGFCIGCYIRFQYIQYKHRKLTN